MPFASAVIVTLFTTTRRPRDLPGRSFLSSCTHCLVAGLFLLAVCSAGASADNAVAAQAAATPGIALLLTASSYNNNPSDGHAGCRSSKQLILNRLRREVYDVVDASDLTRSEIVSAITSFSDKRRAAPTVRAFVYVCGYAASVHRRVFYLPAWQSTTVPLRPETDGILVKQLVELASGKSGIFIADLDPLPDGFSLPVEDVGTLRPDGASGERVDILVHGDRAIGALGRDYGSGGERYGTLEEERSVALLRNAMAGSSASEPLPPLPGLASRMAGAPTAAPALRPVPETSHDLDKTVSSASPMRDRGESVTSLARVAAPSIVAPSEARSRPTRARAAPSFVPATALVRAPVHRAGHGMSHVTASRQLAARWALYRRQMALYRARTSPGLLDMLLGTNSRPPRPAPPRRVVRLSQQLR